MADSNWYPQIPRNIWWGFREILKSKPSAQITTKLLAVQFGVQETAAKAYQRELIKIGMIDEDGKATDLALRWRMDNTYSEAVNEIVTKNYPDELLQTLDVENLDREQAKQWFMFDGMGTGAAGNKVAALALIASNTPGEISATSPAPKPNPEKNQPRKPSGKARKSSSKTDQQEHETEDQGFGAMPLNINVQIHISADASSEQIENIFKSMRKHLR